MKKLVFVVLVMFVSGVIFAQTANNDIMAYFPTASGHTWVYQCSYENIYKGELFEEIIISEGQNRLRATNEIVYTFKINNPHQSADYTILYTINENSVFQRMILLNGRWIEKRPNEAVVISLAGGEWKFPGIGRYQIMKTSRGNISFDGKRYDDCIIMTTEFYYNDSITRINRVYYARNFGLVYESEERPNEPEHFVRKLISFK
jgi:hypothetical protein